MNGLDVRRFYSEFTKLRKVNGRPELKGLCPLHEETNPSFFVNLDTGAFKCFGCGNWYQRGRYLVPGPDFHRCRSGRDRLGECQLCHHEQYGEPAGCSIAVLPISRNSISMLPPLDGEGSSED